MSSLSGVEKRIYGALLVLCNDDMIAKVNLREIAHQIGYNVVGGTITYNIKLLDAKNYITILGDKKYKVHLR